MWPKGEYLNVREAAQRAGRDPETIRRWIWKGKLQAVKVGGQYLMAPSAVDDAVYFQEQRAAGIRVGEPQPEYAVKPEALPNITPEERAAILADIHREWEEMEEDDLEGDFALADEIFRAHGYTDIVGSIREGREERP